MATVVLLCSKPKVRSVKSSNAGSACPSALSGDIITGLGCHGAPPTCTFYSPVEEDAGDGGW